MKLEDLEVGKKYLLAGGHVGELIAKEGDDVYFSIEDKHDYLVEPSSSNYPGTVCIPYYEDLITEL